MRALVQRVKRASVTVVEPPIVSETLETPARAITVGSIGQGMLVLLGITGSDTQAEIEWMCHKLLHLRIFADGEGKMNYSLLSLCEHGVEVGILVVSQFTLYGDARKGFRPSYTQAAPPPVAESLYNTFVEHLRWLCRSETQNLPGSISIQTGIFAAMMDVELVNDGPVTIWIDKEHNAQQYNRT